METNEKTFGELKKGDTIYFYYQGICEVPGRIKEYILEKDPEETYYKNGVNYLIDVRLSENCFCEELEFDGDAIENTLNLDDFNYNCLHYGDEYWYFTTDKERAINNRKKMLEAYIFKTEKNLNILKMELEEHMKEYEKNK